MEAPGNSYLSGEHLNLSCGQNHVLEDISLQSIGSSLGIL